MADKPTTVRSPKRPSIEVAQEKLEIAQAKFNEAKAAFDDFAEAAGLEEKPAPSHPMFISWLERTAKVADAQVKVDIAQARVLQLQTKAPKAAASKAVLRLNLKALNDAGRAAVLAVYNEQLVANPAAPEDDEPSMSDEDAEIKARVQAKRAAREAEAETDSVEELLGLL